MQGKKILITGAAGELGTALVELLLNEGAARIVTMDLKDMSPSDSSVAEHHVGNLLDRAFIHRLMKEHEIEVVFHLAALLSSRAEKDPRLAHNVNVEGTLNVLEAAGEQSNAAGQSVVVIFPSSIAAYGVPDLATKSRLDPIREEEWNRPATMYGCNKLYCDHLGRYLSDRVCQEGEAVQTAIDFRSLRYPGLISAFTIPSGGTSDFAPEMIHAAAKGSGYECFVRPGTTIPFLAMPDAARAAVELAMAPAESLSCRVYNVNGFSVSAGQVQERVSRAFPRAEVTYITDPWRQRIVDSWPAAIDDSRARRDWGWAPVYDVDAAFEEYLIPNIRLRYE